MLYRTKVPLGIKGERVEKGVEIELSEEDFNRFDPNDFEPVAGAPVEAAPEPEPEIKAMTVAQLKAKAEELELATSGSKADLVERITLHLQGGLSA